MSDDPQEKNEKPQTNDSMSGDTESSARGNTTADKARSKATTPDATTSNTDTTKAEDTLSSATDGATEVTFSIIFDDDDAVASAGTDSTDADSADDVDDVDDDTAANTNAAVPDDNAASDVSTAGNEDDTDDATPEAAPADNTPKDAPSDSPDAEVPDAAGTTEPPAAEIDEDDIDEDEDVADEDEDTDDTVSTPANALSIEKGISATIRSTGQEDDILLRSYPTFSLTDVTVVKKSDSRRILDDVTMSFYAGNLYCVGVDPDYTEQHSTFIQVITGLRRPTSGTVMMRSANLAELDAVEARGHRLGIVTQKYRVREGLNAVDNITYAMDASNRNFLKPKKTIAKELLKHVGFPSDGTKDADGPNSPWRVRVGTLSPVQQLRVAIARAISCEAKVLILDEPVVGLDDDESESIMSTLQSLAHDKDPRCVIVVSSDETILDAGDERVDLI
ncbi:ATP-binding cassette domain-containing protein [uncultured Bifidobacterium sp.]|uniref:ATP-binding cassette domain-containing protein n=1 Tax=uncultured Bifidobacterium sp. TaxID=165187 RepID=UPI0026115B30|nr:ATP-binding cassette domain-containing protein [uncultured Bifidobacterium sp.]